MYAVFFLVYFCFICMQEHVVFNCCEEEKYLQNRVLKNLNHLNTKIKYTYACQYDDYMSALIKLLHR